MSLSRSMAPHSRDRNRSTADISRARQRIGEIGPGTPVRPHAVEGDLLALRHRARDGASAVAVRVERDRVEAQWEEGGFEVYRRPGRRMLIVRMAREQSGVNAWTVRKYNNVNDIAFSLMVQKCL
jgi:hypothetical protein